MGVRLFLCASAPRNPRRNPHASPSGPAQTTLSRGFPRINPSKQHFCNRDDLAASSTSPYPKTACKPGPPETASCPGFENCPASCQTKTGPASSIRRCFMPATHNKSVATEESRRFSLSDLAPPLLRRKRMFSIIFLSIVSLALLLPHASSIPLLPAHTSAVLILIAVVLGLLIGLALTYLMDYRDPHFHSSVQVMRTLRVPLVVAIPKRPY